ERALKEARDKLPGLGQQMLDRVSLILQARQAVQQRVGPAAVEKGTGPRRPALTDLRQLGTTPASAASSPAKVHPVLAELALLVPARFPDRIPFERLAQLPRYLKALLTRLERASYNSAKDEERGRLVAPYAAALHALQESRPPSPEAWQAREDFRWMLEEYRVSVFAQELGTAQPVSPKRLDEQLLKTRTLFGLANGRS